MLALTVNPIEQTAPSGSSSTASPRDNPPDDTLSDTEGQADGVLEDESTQRLSDFEGADLDEL